MKREDGVLLNRTTFGYETRLHGHVDGSRHLFSWTPDGRIESSFAIPAAAVGPLGQALLNERAATPPESATPDLESK